MILTMYNPAHPGEILREYIGTVKVSEAAKRLRVARSTLSRLLNGRAAFTAAMALRLSDAFGTSRACGLICSSSTTCGTRPNANGQRSRSSRTPPDDSQVSIPRSGRGCRIVSPRLQSKAGIDEKEALKRLARELGQSKSEPYRKLQREPARRK
ncbi:MAG TPA: HigA family addiction module antitoxin [Terracidiphilus sp.]|nr:HigA family addiction module antitoxin [Terracidiphilus sp.]